jgi:hypothetical protein
MKSHFILVAAISVAFNVLMLPVVSANDSIKHMFVCRSPLLAFDFWSSLLSMQTKGVTVTPQIAEQICRGMKAGNEPQCIRIEANSFKPVASGSDGALAMSDGKTKIWFHNPDAGGWVHPDYYVWFVNTAAKPVN